MCQSWSPTYRCGCVGDVEPDERPCWYAAEMIQARLGGTAGSDFRCEIVDHKPGKCCALGCCLAITQSHYDKYMSRLKGTREMRPGPTTKQYRDKILSDARDALGPHIEYCKFPDAKIRGFLPRIEKAHERSSEMPKEPEVSRPLGKQRMIEGAPRRRL